MDITIRSVSEYIEKCFSNSAFKKDEPLIFYRGVNMEYPRETRHVPSIYFQRSLIENEDKIFKEFLSIFPETLMLKSTIERLVFMQRYRFPTRIMDISKNPLIGLFFASFSDKNQDSLKKDGVVYCYSVPVKDIKYCDSDAVSVIANICKRPFNFSIRNIFNLERECFNNEEEILYLIHEICEEKPYFHPVVNKHDINSVVCLRPRMNNPRIVRQDGYFFLFGIDYDKKECAKMSVEWINEKKFIIPFDIKEKILKELDMLNINEAFIYPDYEHISEVIRNRYSKQNYKEFL